MTKKFTLMMLFLILFGAASFSQTASLATVTASPGQSVPVALDVTGFTGIGSITFHIQFDPSIMTLTGITLPAGSPWLTQGAFWGVTGNTINIVGAWLPDETFTDGKMLDLIFTYNGMTSSPLNFLGTCDVTQGVTPIHPTYTNGSVTNTITAALATVTANPGQNLPVAMNTTGFTGIGSITMHIQFDPTVMTLSGITLPSGSPWSSQGSFWGVTGNTINIVGFWASNATFPDGKMFDLNFTYSGMTTSPLTFIPTGCEVTKGLTVVYPGYTNGSVSMAVVPTEARIIPVTAVPTGGDVSVPLEYKNFTGNVGAITQTLQYDPTKLTFVNVIGTGNLAAGVNFNANSSTGVITITWSNAGGKNINSDVAPYSKFLLNFVFIGNTTANINFLGGSLITSAPPVANVPVTYYNGSVAPGLPTATAKLGAITGAVQGQDYEIPLTLWGFPSGTVGGTQAFTLTIPYDYPKLSFTGLTNPVTGLIVNTSTPGILTLAWSNTTGPDINGTFLKLNFHYNGIGTANVSFGNGCVFNTYNAGVVGTVQVAYTGATIAPAIASANAILGRVQGVAVGSSVNIPINFTGLPDMGAVTLFITYDYTKLTFIDAQNNTFGANVKLDDATHVIKVVWASSGATNLNVKFLDLRFTYNGGGGACGAVTVNFADGCELANLATAIIPANYINGGVNLVKISGTLTYNSDPNPRIPLVGFTVNLKTNPGNLIVANATTTATGYYEIWSAPGSYKLDAVEPASYNSLQNWFADFDDVLALFDYTFTYTLPYQNALRLTAGDVTQSGDIDFDDVLAVFDRTFGTKDPNYTAPDWIFEQPFVSINCVDLQNQDFMGLNSGNVLGSNQTP